MTRKYEFAPGDRVRTDCRIGNRSRRGEVVEEIEVTDSKGRRLRAFMVRFEGSSRAERIFGHRLMPEDAPLDI